jgi:hypothetical protein
VTKQLADDTIAAMERLSTSPLKPAMTEIEELRARVEALEAAQQRPPHQDKLDRLIALDADDGKPIVVPSVKDPLTVPAGSLVKLLNRRLINSFATGGTWDETSCAVILEVAAWLRSEQALVAGNSNAFASLLEQEANR